MSRLVDIASDLHHRAEEASWRLINPDWPTPRETARAKATAVAALERSLLDFNAMPNGSAKVEYALREIVVIGSRLQWTAGKPVIKRLAIDAHIADRTRMAKYCFYVQTVGIHDAQSYWRRPEVELTDQQREAIDDALTGYCRWLKFDFFSKYER